MISARISARLIVLGILLTMAVLLPPGMTGLTGASSVVAISARKIEAPRLLPCGQPLTRSTAPNACARCCRWARSAERVVAIGTVDPR